MVEFKKGDKVAISAESRYAGQALGRDGTIAEDLFKGRDGTDWIRVKWDHNSSNTYPIVDLILLVGDWDK